MALGLHSLAQSLVWREHGTCITAWCPLKAGPGEAQHMFIHSFNEQLLMPGCGLMSTWSPLVQGDSKHGSRHVWCLRP